MTQINQQTFRRSDALLPVALLLPPAAWLGALESSYMLVHKACQLQSKLLLLGIDLFAALACVVAAAIGGSIFRRVSEAQPDAFSTRTRFMAIGSVAMAGFFLLVVLAMSIPNLTLRACD
jgi:hypothetical protein